MNLLSLPFPPQSLITIRYFIYSVSRSALLVDWNKVQQLLWNGVLPGTSPLPEQASSIMT